MQANGVVKECEADEADDAEADGKSVVKKASVSKGKTVTVVTPVVSNVPKPKKAAECSLAEY